MHIKASILVSGVEEVLNKCSLLFSKQHPYTHLLLPPPQPELSNCLAHRVICALNAAEQILFKFTEASSTVVDVSLNAYELFSKLSLKANNIK